MDYAHRHDDVHRDIKLENIMIHDGHAVVTDLGIGKAVTAAADGADTLTQTGVTVGTPAYMAPEQAAGNSTLTDGPLRARPLPREEGGGGFVFPKLQRHPWPSYHG